MPILIDTDAFCKIGSSGLLRDAISLFGLNYEDCRRLSPLPHMLRRGSLRRKFGEVVCNSLIPIAELIPALEQPSDAWLDQLAPIHNIDPGEAQLYALAADADFMIISGDKRALRALKEVADFPAALAGKIILLEALLIALCLRYGVDHIRNNINNLSNSDTMTRICFSQENEDPLAALWSYYNDAVNELRPLILWDPRQGEE